MALFDQTTTIQAKLEDVWQRIQREVAPEQQIVTNKLHSTLLAVDKQYGYLYIMRETPDGAVKLRHMVDTVSRVREIFRTAQGSERLTLLAQPTNDIDSDEREFIADEAQQRLDVIQRAAKRKPKSFETASVEDYLQDEQSSPYGNPSKLKRSGDVPGDPRTYLAYAFFVTTIGVGIAYGFNWRRLGKPQWMLPTILLAILIPVVSMGGIFGFFSFAVGMRSDLFRFSAASVFALFGLSWGTVFSLMYLQYSPYKKWKDGNSEGMVNHTYDFLSATLICLGTAGAASIIGLTMKLPDYGPRVYQGDYVQITYPYDWEVRDMIAIGACNDPTTTCEFLLSNHDRRASIQFYWVSLDEPQSLDEYAAARWGRIQQYNFDTANLKTRYTQIDGQEAFVREYLARVEPQGLRFHYMETYIMWDEQTVFAMRAAANCTCDFNDNRADIESIVQSVRLQMPGAGT